MLRVFTSLLLHLAVKHSLRRHVQSSSDKEWIVSSNHDMSIWMDYEPSNKLLRYSTVAVNNWPVGQQSERWETQPGYGWRQPTDLDGVQRKKREVCSFWKSPSLYHHLWTSVPSFSSLPVQAHTATLQWAFKLGLELHPDPSCSVASIILGWAAMDSSNHATHCRIFCLTL